MVEIVKLGYIIHIIGIFIPALYFTVSLTSKHPTPISQQQMIYFFFLRLM